MVLRSYVLLIQEHDGISAALTAPPHPPPPPESTFCLINCSGLCSVKKCNNIEVAVKVLLKLICPFFVL